MLLLLPVVNDSTCNNKKVSHGPPLLAYNINPNQDPYRFHFNQWGQDCFLQLQLQLHRVWCVWTLLYLFPELFLVYGIDTRHGGSARN